MSDIAIGDTVRINQNCTCEEWVGLTGIVSSVIGESVSVLIYGENGRYRGNLHLSKDRFDIVERADSDTAGQGGE